MKVFIAFLFLGLLPLCTTLNCYQCISSSAGCNDPFSATGSGVSITNSSSITYCTKVKTAGIVWRAGVSGCIAATVDGNTATTCCQTDLCNGAHGQYKTSILLAFSLFVILIKFK